MKPRIISDSSCDLSDNFLENDDIDFSVVPLTFVVGDRKFTDDENLDVMEMITAMKECKTASTSSCPSPEDFAKTLRSNVENYIITITSSLSGTYNSARLGREMALNEDPDKKIRLFDSLATSSTMILMIMKLRDLIKSHKYDFDTICAKLSEYQKTLRLRFLVLDLSNLIKTGRMGRITGLVASALSIFPICGDDGTGQIKVYAKVRGAKKALSQLAAMVEEKISKIKEFPVVITHCNNTGQAEELKELLKNRFALNEIYIFPMRGLTSYYANDKGLIMAF